MTDWLEIDGANPWRTESTRVIFENPRLRLIEDEVTQPDGLPGSYVYLHIPGPIVAVVAVDADQYVYLVRQWRYVWGCNSWEIPSGGGAIDESPLGAARRELAEEVGLAASEWQPLGGGRSSATMQTNWHFFLARGLSRVATAERDGSEHDLVARRVPLASAVEAAIEGRIEHGMSVVGLVRAARRLGI